MLSFGGRFVLLAAILPLAPQTAAANAYFFKVSCPMESFVAQWASGDPDPGRSHFRIATGDLNLDCSVYDYDPRTDRDLPRRWCSGPDGIIRGFPPALIVLGQSHCR